MTTADVIAHWRKGAKDALRVAILAHQNGAEELALFNCHLAVEKALKAAVMEKTKKPHPKIHSLWNLAVMLSDDWSTSDKELFDTLSDFAIAARYDDPQWAQRFATAENAGRWMKRTEKFLASLHAMKTLTKKNGLAIARTFRDAIVSRGYPVQRMFLYGSVARGEATEDSDVDIAILCKPFAASRHEENMIFRRIRWDIDARIEPFTLHPDDFGKPYFALPYEVEREGVEV